MDKTTNARRLRRDQTLAEKAFWDLVRNRRLGGFRFLRQVPINRVFADFVYRSGEDDHRKDMFSRADFDALRDLLAALHGRFLLTSNDRPETRALFDGFEIVEAAHRYRISGAPTEAKELIVRWGRVMANEIAVYGAVTGTLALGLSVLNFLRDGARVEVALVWDQSMTGDAARMQKMGYVRITNVGRRPIFLSHVHLTGSPAWNALILSDGVKGRTLPEGAEPFVCSVFVDHDLEAEIGPVWWKCRAVAIDGAGRLHHSDWPTKPPSFASASPGRLLMGVAHALNWARRLRASIVL